jgi:putative colanic acid biosynthesis acetyltransferase WcaF
LRIFGAKIGNAVRIRPSARITNPWRLTVGARSWIGDDVDLYCLGDIKIGSDTVISQRSYLCTASHDCCDPAFPITTKAISINDGVWLATDVFIAPGISVGVGAVVGARASVFQDVPEMTINMGSPSKTVGKRIMRRDK